MYTHDKEAKKSAFPVPGTEQDMQIAQSLLSLDLHVRTTYLEMPTLTAAGSKRRPSNTHQEKSLGAIQTRPHQKQHEDARHRKSYIRVSL